jgi:hypothetical protein
VVELRAATDRAAKTLEEFGFRCKSMPESILEIANKSDPIEEDWMSPQDIVCWVLNVMNSSNTGTVFKLPRGDANGLRLLAIGCAGRIWVILLKYETFRARYGRAFRQAAIVGFVAVNSWAACLHLTYQQEFGRPNLHTPACFPSMASGHADR